MNVLLSIVGDVCGAHPALCMCRRALGDISNPQRSRKNTPNTAGMKNLKLKFAPIISIATAPATPAIAKKADDPLEVCPHGQARHDTYALLTLTRTWQVECMFTGPKIDSPEPSDCDIDIDAVVRRMQENKVKAYGPRPVELPPTPAQLSPEPMKLFSFDDPDFDEDDDECGLLRWSLVLSAAQTYSLPRPAVGMPAMKDLLADPEIAGEMDGDIEIHVALGQCDDDDSSSDCGDGSGCGMEIDDEAS